MTLLQVGISPEQLQVPIVWHQRDEEGTDGRRKAGYTERSTGRAWIASVDGTETVRMGQVQHPVSHNVVYDTAIPTAKPGDYFRANGKRFYVLAVQNPGELSLVVLFKTEERPDRDG